MTLTSSISTNTTANVSLTLSVAVSPKILQISLDKTLGENTVIRFDILPLWPSTLKTRNPVHYPH